MVSHYLTDNEKKPTSVWQPHKTKVAGLSRGMKSIVVWLFEVMRAHDSYHTTGGVCVSAILIREKEFLSILNTNLLFKALPTGVINDEVLFDSTDMRITKEGALDKMGVTNPSWFVHLLTINLTCCCRKARYFRLQNGVLFYYKTQKVCDRVGGAGKDKVDDII